MGVGHVLLGVILALAGAANLALGMVIQRMGLAFPQERIPCLKWSLNRHVVWFLGLLTYGAGNGLYAASLVFGPLSLLSGIFTTLLVWNLLFARVLLGEKLTGPNIGGALVILVGVVMCFLATPEQTTTIFLPADILRLCSVSGVLYLVILAIIVVVSVVAIAWFEKKYPQPKGVHAEEVPVAQPPVWLNRLMSLVYPGSLGVDEGVAHLTMKATLSMFDACAGGVCMPWQEPILWPFFLIWILASFATVWWLRKVFTRYESTIALPIDYGILNAVSACSGLIFYQEHESMQPWQLALMSCGVLTILTGVALPQLVLKQKIPTAEQGEEMVEPIGAGYTEDEGFRLEEGTPHPSTQVLELEESKQQAL